MSVPPDPSSNQPPKPRKGRDDATTRKPARRDAALRRTVVRPAGLTVDPIDSAFVSDRMTTLTHELANLLDGSMRCLSLARRGVGDDRAAPQGDVARHLDTVHAAMRQMSELVKCAMQGVSLSHAPGAPGDAGSMSEAIHHGIEVMTPLAEERGVRLSVELESALADIPSSSAFIFVANGVRNAIESIERSGHTQGHVELSGRTERGRTGQCVVLEIVDDGEGPPALRPRGGESPFRLGYSTKAGGSGVGLALCRELAQELGGTIELIARNHDPASGRGGAMLRLRFPVPRDREFMEDPPRP